MDRLVDVLSGFFDLCALRSNDSMQLERSSVCARICSAALVLFAFVRGVPLLLLRLGLPRVLEGLGCRWLRFLPV